MREIPVASAFRESLRDGYGWQTGRADLSAGIVVSLIALPLSMALAIAVGLPPQHGLYTAIVAGFVTAILGGSKVQVTGPTAAFVAILAPIVTQYGLAGLIWCQIMAGVLLILLGLFRCGRYIAHVPYAVVTGFTAGIAVVIATLSLNDFLGLGLAHLSGHYWEKVATLWNALPQMHTPDLVVGAVTLIVIMGTGKLTKTFPPAVAGMMVACGLSLVAQRMGLSVDTIATRFSYMLPDGSAGAGLPSTPPQVFLPPMPDLAPLLIPAATIAVLSALESLLSATVADNMTEERHHPESELIGVGAGNLVSALFAGIPATGALARTAANIQAGAKTPVASVLHALLLLVYMMVFAQAISAIPMSALAALLLMTAWRMAHVHVVRDILRAGNHKDTIILLTTFFLTILFDMVVGVGVGLALSYAFHILRR